MTGLEGAGVQKRPSGTSLGRVSRAVEAELTQEACVALDALLAEVERGERADAAPLTLCSRVLGMCQKAGKAKPALRLLQRMELCGMPIGPVQLRQVFFACCARGMITDALALMSRRDRESNARMLGKDVLVRGCDLMPGGVDGEAGMALLEGTLRGIAGGGWEPIPANFGGVRVHEQPPWRPPPPRAEAAEEAGGGDPAHPGLFPLAPRGGDPAADARSARPDALPRRRGRLAEFLVRVRRRRSRRPADREGLQLWAPSTPQTIPVAPAGLEPETERHDVPHVAGAFALSGLLTRRETAAPRGGARGGLATRRAGSGRAGARAIGLRGCGVARDGGAVVVASAGSHARRRRGDQPSVPVLQVRTGDRIQAPRGRIVARGRVDARGRVRHGRQRRETAQ